jgi:serine/threonine-protein kinase
MRAKAERGPTRIAKIVVGIALAMRFVHSRGIVHRDLKPENILVWDWVIWISDFGHSASHSIAQHPLPDAWPLIAGRYLARECFDNFFLPASDVFSFGLILHEIWAVRLAFVERLNPCQIGSKILIEGIQPDIPQALPPDVRALIADFLEADPYDRPSFDEL